MIKKNNSNHEYDKTYFDSFFRKAVNRSFHPVQDFRIWYICKFLNPKKVLDVGCGLGLMVRDLRNRGIEAFGIDISADAIKSVPSEVAHYCFEGNILNIPYGKNSFDTVICVDVLEHIAKEELIKAIKECARVAKKNIYFDITALEDILFVFSDPTHITKQFSWQWHKQLLQVLGAEWTVKRGPILLGIHHGIFIATKKI